MKTSNIRKIIAPLGVVGAILLLSACGSEPSPWAKSDSPWDQRRSQGAEAPAAEEYKQDLGDMEGTGTEDDLNYQAEPVDGYAPGAEAAPMAEAAAGTQELSAEEEILSQPETFYTVQVMASVDIDRVYKFAEQNQLSVRYIIPTLRDGVTWHVLLMDIYPDYETAKGAVDEAASILPTKPWIRKLGSVQRLMK